MRLLTLAKLQQRTVKLGAAQISTSLPQLAGEKWRLKHGLGKCGNEYGPLTDIPDWSYADGRPAPVWPSEMQRREKQKRLAKTAVELISELKFAKKRFQEKNLSSNNKLGNSAGTSKK